MAGVALTIRHRHWQRILKRLFRTAQKILTVTQRLIPCLNTLTQDGKSSRLHNPNEETGGYNRCCPLSLNAAPKGQLQGLPTTEIWSDAGTPIGVSTPCQKLKAGS
tara:strand:- start:573 stop:890 length:318 start_codon:yes stop_codon:yes gene_type:complete